jgi:hypothetical protein
MKKILLIVILSVLFCAPIAIGQSVTTYSFNPITNNRIYPDTIIQSSCITNNINLRTCPGEFIASTFVIKSSETLNSFLPVPSNLVNGIFSIDSSNVDIKIVKCWYQKGDELSAPSDTTRLFLPELLINDNDLIHTTYISMTEGSNYLRTSTGYVSINAPGEGSETALVYDSPTLLPLVISANKNQQFWMTIYVPDTTVAGNYTGSISLKEANVEIGQIHLSVEVLPFILTEAPLDISLYYTSRIYDNIPSLGTYGRSEEQLHAEFKDLLNHGVANPVIGCQSYYNSLTNFVKYCQIRQEEGMKFDTIYYTSDNIPESQYFNTVALINTRVPEIINYFTNNYGTKEVYFYINDEEDVVPYATYISAIRANGGKTMDAQSSAEALSAANYNPPLLDLATIGGAPVPTLISYYHSKGLKMGSYGNPQCGLEKPLEYRRNYGLLLWQCNLDESGTFAYSYGNYRDGYRNNWNDWNWFGGNRYKIHAFAYPTSNGVVDTMAWEGFREGVNDIRYVVRLEQEIGLAKQKGLNTASAESYLNNLHSSQLSSLNLDTVRNDIINHIIILRGQSIPGFELSYMLLTLALLPFIYSKRKH